MTAEERVKIVVEAQDKASSVLRSVGGNANKLLDTVLKFAGGGLAAFGIGRAISEALDVGQVGAGLINLERSFERFADSMGQSADDVLAEMQRMSNGMLTEVQAMEQYNKTFLLMGAEMAAEMPKFIQVAMAASSAGMGEFNYLLNSMVVATGRLSPLIADNLGFSIKLSEAFGTYATSIGKAANELTKAEQQQAFFNAMMAQATDRFGDLDQAAGDMAGGSIARLKATWADLANEAKTNVTPAVEELAQALLDVTNAAAAGIPGTSLYLERLIADSEKMLASGDLFTFKAIADPGEYLDILFGNMDQLSAEQRRRVQQLVRAYETIYPTEAGAMALRQQQQWIAGEEQMIAAAERLAGVQETISLGAAGFLVTEMEGMAAQIAETGKWFGEQSAQADNARFALENLLQTTQGLTVSEDAYARITEIATDALDAQNAALSLAVFQSNNFISGQTNASAATASLTAELNRQRIAALGLTDSTVLMEQHYEMLAQAEEDAAREAQRAAQAMREGKGSLEELSDSGDRTTSIMSALTTMMGRTEAATLIAAHGVSTLRRAMDLASKTGRDFLDVLGAISNTAEHAKGILQRADMGRGFRGVAKDLDDVGSASSDLEDELDSLQDTWEGLIESFLSPTQSVDVEDLKDQMGLHEETWDEFARRRADIVQLGKASPWTPEDWMGLPDEEVKARALQDIEDFYAFRLPEAINTDAIKQKVRDYIETQNNLQDVVSQIQGELAAEGLDVTTPDVQRALGVDLEAIGAADANDYNGSFLSVLSGATGDYSSKGRDFVSAMKTGMLNEAKNSGQFRRDLTDSLSPELDEAVLRVLKKYWGGGGSTP